LRALRQRKTKQEATQLEMIRVQTDSLKCGYDLFGSAGLAGWLLGGSACRLQRFEQLPAADHASPAGKQAQEYANRLRWLRWLVAWLRGCLLGLAGMQRL
jgi:hypothetical protein